MRVLIVSDTHGQNARLRQAAKRARPFDMLIHCGDLECDPKEIKRIALCPCVFVGGNCDYNPDLPSDQIVEAGKYRIYVVHGHRHSISYGYERVIEAAKENNCNVIVFGHTHRPFIDDTDPNLIIMNPGSLDRPRQEGRKPSYILMDIDETGRAKFEIRYLLGAVPRVSFW